jgi:hypothetical protein
MGYTPSQKLELALEHGNECLAHIEVKAVFGYTVSDVVRGRYTDRTELSHERSELCEDQASSEAITHLSRVPISKVRRRR